ncbi:MAG: hypothetical protein R3B07_04915 [Polyangiaceae bacterium]
MGGLVAVKSRRASRQKLLKEYPGASIVDLTSKAEAPFVRFSPFFPHGNIPVPFSAPRTAASVEGIWQALKVFESEDVDESKLDVRSMRGIKRSVRRFGRCLGHRAGLHGERLLGYLEAREQIYLPSYSWVLRHCLRAELEALRGMARRGPLLLLDYETNADVADLSKPLSHAALVMRHLVT